jgi:hypothetical protein
MRSEATYFSHSMDPRNSRILIKFIIVNTINNKIKIHHPISRVSAKHLLKKKSKKPANNKIMNEKYE